MSKKCRNMIYIGIILTVFIFVYSMFSFFHQYGIFSIRFDLLGEEKITLALHESYQEYGYEVYYRGKSYHSEVEISDNIKTDQVGEYTITYYVPSLNVRKKRIVEVKDEKKPIVTLNGESIIHTFVNHEFIDEGASAFDDYDGDLTSSIKVNHNVDLTQEGEYKIVYTVKDKAGNKASITRKVVVCLDPTKVSLSYHYDMYDNEAMQWWFKKSENHQRNEGAIASKTLKKYDAYYIGEDEKVIYLTFDEGGSERTYIKEIANLLNRYEIQGTFFLTKNYILKEAEFIRDLIAHGHVIGNHTHNHLNMATLAKEESMESFCKEVTSVEKAYMQVSGSEMIKVFRFPKGEASERTMKMLSDMGYKTFFWSHAYYDYGEELSYEKAYNNMMNYYHNGAIYLMHPNNKGNYVALEAFIKEMLDKGYTFKTVDQIK